MAVVPERCDFCRGEVIDGKYRIDKELGQGTFGVVYRVSGQDGATYALKLLKLWTVPIEVYTNLRKRFVMEFETGQIPSSHLAHSYEYGEVLGNPYIVMEFCPNGDLRHFAETRDVDYDSVGEQVLSGLQDLHDCGKVHRDLKPENVLMRGDNSAVLTDFGISGDRNNRMTSRNFLGKPTQIFGSYPYMPPEQVNPPRGGQATVLPTTDIFSFGVMMYEMMVGKLPFGELTMSSITRYQENARIGKWDRKSLQKVDREGIWTEIIEGCLVGDYRHRIQSAKEVLEKLPNAKPRESQTYVPLGDNLRLRIMQGDEYGRVYDLSGKGSSCGLLTMGRADVGSSNAINVREDECHISRRHCTLEYDIAESRWYLRDGQWHSGEWRESLNGTYLNSMEVGTGGMPIAVGDIITTGDTKMRVEGDARTYGDNY